MDFSDADRFTAMQEGSIGRNETEKTAKGPSKCNV